MRFESRVELGGKTATGIRIPDEVVASLGSSKRPPVTITINGYTYRTTAVRMGGAFFVPLAAENREAAGRRGRGRRHRRHRARHRTPRGQLPDDLAAAMDDAARTAYDGLSYTHRKEWVRWVEEAKKPETRATRVEKTVAGLKRGQEDPLRLTRAAGTSAAASCARRRSADPPERRAR